MTQDVDAQAKATTAELYQQLYKEELEKCGGETAAAAANALVRLKGMSSPAAVEVNLQAQERQAEELNGEGGGAANSSCDAATDSDVTGSASSPADLRERRLQALEEAQAQAKKQKIQNVPATSFQRAEQNVSTTTATQSADAPQAPENTGSTPTAAELRERRLQALEAGQQQAAKALANHNTSSTGFRKREWDSVNVLNNTSTKMAEAGDKPHEQADVQQEGQAPALPANLTGVVLAPQGFDPPPRTETASEPSIVGGVLVKRATSNVSAAEQATEETASPKDADEDDEELRKALAMSLDDPATAESKPTEAAPTTPTGQKRKVATEPQDLEALAQKLEKGEVKPEDVEAAAESLRETAKKIRQLEATAMHFAQTLQVVQMVVARSGVPNMFGDDDGSAGANPGSPTGGFPLARMQQPEENTKSYLFKRGESKAEEPEQPQVRTVSWSGSSGTTSSPTNGTPSNASGALTCGGQAALTREEMDQQRKERLQRLEAQQDLAKKEKDAMDAKQRARDAMFNAAGPKKT